VATPFVFRRQSTVEDDDKTTERKHPFLTSPAAFSVEQSVDIPERSVETPKSAYEPETHSLLSQNDTFDSPDDDDNPVF
jgi:hypothetical protein